MNTMLEAHDLPWQELDASLRAFIARRVRNPADVDDLVQRVLFQLVRGLGALRDADRLHAWVYRTARNVVVDHYRADGSRRELAAGSAVDIESAAGSPAHDARDDDEEEMALRELAACLAPMLDRLPAAYRDALRIVDLDGVTQVEAARRAGVSLSGMKSRVQRGRRQLREILEACCRVDLDRRGSIASYAARSPDACGCAGCETGPSDVTGPAGDRAEGSTT